MISETVISAEPSTRLRQYLRDIWDYRDLFFALFERDIKVRYKQTFLGVLWVILTPLISTFIFTIIFVRVVSMPTQGLPPMLFFLAAMVPWSCFSNGVSQAASSLENSSGLISKVYFPRLIVPWAATLSAAVDFLIGWLFFNILAAVMGYWTWLFIPFTMILLILQMGTAIGFGVILSTLNAQYRDVRYAIPFLIQTMMWVTPVIWSSQRLLETRFGDSLRFFLYLNPMAGVIESYRALLTGNYIPYRMLTYNFGVVIGLLFISIWFFRKKEQQFVDLL